MNKPVKCPKDTCIFKGTEGYCTLRDEDEITCATHTKLVIEQYGPQTYHDKLVAMIKACGQELIDRAEEMVSEDAKPYTDVDINILLGVGKIPTITWNIETVATRAVEVLGANR